MKSILALIAAAVLPAAAQSIPPQQFGLPISTNNTVLSVAFNQAAGQAVVVQPGQLFGKQITQTKPNVALNGKNSSSLATLADLISPLLLVMIDPDAPTPDAPTASAFLHWMATDMKATTAAQDFGALQGQSVLANATPNVVPFIPPGPPTSSSAHRYILYLFAQPDNFTVPPAFSKFSDANRAKFDINAFVADAKLDPPVAANFMYISSQTAVPGDFQGPPFSTFPGGNGNAIGLPGSTAGPAAGPAVSDST